MTRPLPTFLIIGAQKAGTSWLERNLRRHPEVFLASPKEVHFFDQPDNLARGLEWYEGFFRDAGEAKAIGEATPNYLGVTFRAHRAHMARTIRSMLPQVRIIVVLRDPVSRAFSALMHQMRQGSLSALTRPDRYLIDLIERRRDDAKGILELSNYADQLRIWREAFPPEQMRVLIYETDVAERSRQTLAEVSHFIGVDNGHAFDAAEERVHAGLHTRPAILTAQMRPRSLSRHLAERVDRLGQASPIRLSPETDQRLREHFRPMVQDLARILGRDLSAWETTGDAATPSSVPGPGPMGDAATGASAVRSGQRAGAGRSSTSCRFACVDLREPISTARGSVRSTPRPSPWSGRCPT